MMSSHRFQRSSGTQPKLAPGRNLPASPASRSRHPFHALSLVLGFAHSAASCSDSRRSRRTPCLPWCREANFIGIRT
jgi:hypothetical protein